MAGLSKNKLRNIFYVIRHGEAVCNVERLLVSDPDIGTTQYGLTDLGRQQAKDAADKFKSMLSSSVDQTLSKKLVIVSSDFRRTRETAEILHSELGVEQPIRFEIALRERGLGKFNMTHGGPDIVKLLSEDEIDPSNNLFGCESIMSMRLRTSSLVYQLDKEYNNKIFILVSHGATCHSVYSVFTGISPNDFHEMPYVQNCEIRQL